VVQEVVAEADKACEPDVNCASVDGGGNGGKKNNAVKVFNAMTNSSSAVAVIMFHYCIAILVHMFSYCI